MSPNPDGYNDAVNLTRLLQQEYEKVRKEMQAVAAAAAHEEVQRVAAQNERELQRLIGEAVAKQRGGGALSSLSATRVLVAVAALVVLWFAVPFAYKKVVGVGSGDDTVSQDTTMKELEEEPLPPINHDPLHQVAVTQFDALFERRDPLIRRLITVEGAKATIDSTVTQALARWSDDSTAVTDKDRDMVHAAAFQAALRRLSGGEYAAPLNGRVERADCAKDEACRRLVERWRADRTTGMRLLPPIPDGRTPNAKDLIAVEKVVIYSRLEQ